MPEGQRQPEHAHHEREPRAGGGQGRPAGNPGRDHGGGHGRHGGHHAGHDHAGMVADFRRRFWVSLALTVPVLALAPMIQGVV